MKKRATDKGEREREKARKKKSSRDLEYVIEC